MSLDSVVTEARRAIHDNDIERLRQLIAEYPALLSWRGAKDDGGLVGMATEAYGDSFDADREQTFTRAACAELLIDAGAVVSRSVCDGLIESRARGLLQLFNRKGLLPHTLAFRAALGDRDGVRTLLAENGPDLAAVNEAFFCACRFRHGAVASLLLDASIALDPALGRHVDDRVGRPAFIAYCSEHGSLDRERATAVGPWRTFVMSHVTRAMHDRSLPVFVDWLQREPWLLEDDFVWFQVALIDTATLNGLNDFIVALLDLEPALLRCQPRPPSQAIEFAFTYAHTDLLPVLTRIWPIPDDLAHAAGLGDLHRVTSWFDESGALALGDLGDHYPYNDARARAHLHWDPPTAQHVLDTALAFSVINRHFEVADFLLAHGADINTNWNSHEPASILHHLVFQDDYDAMQFLIDRGIDLTIKDHRWKSNAQGWARYGKQDEKMAQWLEEAERRPRRT